MTTDVKVKNLFEIYCGCTEEQKSIINKEIYSLLNNDVRVSNKSSNSYNNKNTASILKQRNI
jgi:hypothetical protein